MAAAVVQHSGIQGAASNQIAFTLNGVTAGNTVVVIFVQTSSAIRTYTLTGFTPSIYHNPGRAAGAFYQSDVAGGTMNFTLGASGSASFEGIAFEVSGLGDVLDIGSITEAVASDSHESSDSDVSVEADGLVFCTGTLNGSTSGITEGANYTRVSGSPSDDTARLFQYRVPGSTTTERGSWTSTGTDRTNLAGVMVSFSPAATGGTNYTLTADPGSFTWTGTSASLEYNRKIVADSGTFTWTGTDVTFKRSLRLIAEAGSFAWTGTAATFKRALRLIADPGSWNWTGTAATLDYSGATEPEAPASSLLNWVMTFFRRR